MSNHLAVANVTLALRNRLEGALDRDVGGARVTMVRPGDKAATPETGANVFLYRISANAAMRNADLPSRRPDGTLAQRPTAALNLHYLVSFYGDDKTLETQRLLGATVRTLHTWPTLDRTALRSAATANYLAGSDIAEAVESVRLCPLDLELEEMSKLWSVLLQTPYALSIAYDASVVMIESDQLAEPSLPVQRRNLYAVPLAQPVIERIGNVDDPDAPITANSRLLIEGRSLRGEMTSLRIGPDGQEFAPDSVTVRRIVFALTTLPAAQRRAGVQALQVVHRRLMGAPAAAHAGSESNVAPFVLRPTIDAGPTAGSSAVSYTPASGTGSSATPARVRVTLTPTVGKSQRAVLLLNRLGDDEPGLAFVARVRSGDTKTISFDTPRLTTGSYLVRVAVDGAESVLETDEAGALAEPRLDVP